MLRSLTAVIMVTLVGCVFGNVASITFELGSQQIGATQAMSLGGAIYIHPYMRDIGGLGGIIAVKTATKSYDRKQVSGSTTTTTSTSIGGFAIDILAAPFAEIGKGDGIIYPMFGISILSGKEKYESSGTTTETEYGTNFGLSFGVGAEIFIMRNICFSGKLLKRLVTGVVETDYGTYTEEVDVPIGGTDVSFGFGVSF